jgi:hypothetical protein
MARRRTFVSRQPRASSCIRSTPAIAGPRYRRSRDLPSLLPLFAWDVAHGGLMAQGRLVALLRRALRIERQRGLRGDWAYDLARHERLLRAYRHELQLLQESRIWARSPLAARA